MNRRNSKSWSWAVAFCCSTLLFCSSAQASGHEDGTSLMLEVTPPQGGSLNLVSGVHSYDRFAEVTLVATPKPGYQFVYWMGNVADATTGTTTVFLDSPKMVIAVFERSKFEMVGLESDNTVGDGGGGRLIRGRGESDTSLEQAGGGRRPPKFHLPNSPNPNVDVPVPDKGESDPPVPVPEPVTAALFFAGFLMLTKNRRSGANITEKT